MFFFEIHWHDLGFLGKILIFLGFLGKNNCQDLGKKSKKSKILATNEKNPRSWQEIQDYLRSWQENQDAKHWETTDLSSHIKRVNSRINVEFATILILIK